ncbi:hypothetical protein VFPPC_10536 [Pochonia chlamydosporia 170]|uniref:Uncharacterized protein n=1 Tax=Pochonia chlamydosporia 170 TaxID=1380566 RepID=A0A179F308_METCM|nr:hypothetical protein VFPPC_10536 [Pochonia chlamydosporia 170]OAQ59479.1 hypothetical protein VFPPC_10536 [Pochonia chlamydosporia 170]
MEGAGVWDELPSCMIIKGVCDYADSHKSKGWQRYAAATAASTAKALLGKYFTNRQSKSPKQHRIFSVPFAENDSFVGRDNVIKSLMDMLFAKRKGRVALEKEPARSVLWLPAFSMAAFELACMDLVEKLNLPRNKDNNDGRELIQQHLSLESIGRWLLILDNADSEEVMHGCEGVPGIFAYLPRSQHGQVLVGSNK